MASFFVDISLYMFIIKILNNSYKEKEVKTYLLKLSEDLHSALKARAATEKKSVKDLLTEIIESYLKGRVIDG